MKEKLEYINLDLNNIPQSIKEFEPLKFKALGSYEEGKYKQYRYIPVKDIQILLIADFVSLYTSS